LHVSTLGPEGVETATLKGSSKPPWRIEVSLGSRRYEATGGDLFTCLLEIRRDLELHGYLLCCMGALPDVWPSGLANQMSGGRLAYRHPSGRRPSLEDLVDVFHPAPCDQVVTVEIQEKMRGIHSE
jgi:hypothetical protein